MLRPALPLLAILALVFSSVSFAVVRGPDLSRWKPAGCYNERGDEDFAGPVYHAPVGLEIPLPADAEGNRLLTYRSGILYGANCLLTAKSVIDLDQEQRLKIWKGAGGGRRRAAAVSHPSAGIGIVRLDEALDARTITHRRARYPWHTTMNYGVWIDSRTLLRTAPARGWVGFLAGAGIVRENRGELDWGTSAPSFGLGRFGLSNYTLYGGPGTDDPHCFGAADKDSGRAAASDVGGGVYVQDPHYAMSGPLAVSATGKLAGIITGASAQPYAQHTAPGSVIARFVPVYFHHEWIQTAARTLGCRETTEPAPRAGASEPQNQ